MECCGVEGPRDWIRITHSTKLPTTCCTAIPLDGFCTETDSFKFGCFQRFKTQLENNEKIIMWSCIGFASIQVCKNIPIQLLFISKYNLLYSYMYIVSS